MDDLVGKESERKENLGEMKKEIRYMYAYIYVFYSFKRSFNYLLTREIQITLQLLEGKNGGNGRGK